MVPAEATESSKKALLFFSPVLPSHTGGGIAMRAGMVLEALSEHYRLTLIVIPLYVTLERDIPEFLARICERITILSPGAISFKQIKEMAEAVGPLEIVHVFRLAAMELVFPYLRELRGQVRLHLDMDDIESKTQRRISAVSRLQGNDVAAAAALGSGQRASMLEAIAFRLFDRIYVCSEGDRRELAERCTAEVRVLRNVVRLPADVSLASHSAVFRFLFVGTLGYYPNQDAVRFFCTEVLPLIREQAKSSVRLTVIGFGHADNLLDLASEEVNLVGPVPDLRPWYQECDAVVVPLRAGGGTRVKILEAFSYLRPVVATTLGVEGIEAVGEHDLLVADSPGEFADACLRLMSDLALRQSLVANAKALVSNSYTLDTMKTSIKPD